MRLESGCCTWLSVSFLSQLCVNSRALHAYKITYSLTALQAAFVVHSPTALQDALQPYTCLAAPKSLFYIT